MSILVTGKTGQLGRALEYTERSSSDDASSRIRYVDRQRLDLEKPQDIATALDALHAEQPIEQIINTAAYTAVDAAEDPTEAPRARLINEIAVG